MRWLLLLLCLTVWLSAPLARAQESTQPTPSPTLDFKPEVPLPNFVGGPISATTFAEYIRAVFVLFIWVVGILAGVMIVWGGIKWVSAAGNPGRISDARDIVNNAVIGLVLALVSVVLLNIINPRLTSFRGITLTTVKPIPFETDVVTGKFGEGAKACTTKGGARIVREAQCFITAIHLTWPVSGAGHAVKSHFGPRDAGEVGSSCHPGVDLSTDRVTGKTLVATHTGTIRNLAPSVRCGEYTLEVVAQTGFYTRYVHVKQALVTNGQRVQAGEAIGYSGGNPSDSPAIKACSGGPHLHIEIYDNQDELRDIEPCLQ